MTTDDFIKLHMDEAFRLMRRKEPVTGHETSFEINRRADELVVAQRHMICCWALREATEGDIATWVKTFEPPPGHDTVSAWKI